MTHMRPKLVVLFVAIGLSMAAMTGCVQQSKYDATVAELTKQAEKLSQAEQEKAQLQKDLDAMKGEAEKAEQGKNEAETKITTLEQENAELKKQAEKAEQDWNEADAKITTLKQENAELKKQAAQLSLVEQEKLQLQKDLVAAKAAAEKAEQAKNGAEARIETLEAENAELKKQPPESESPTE